MNIHGLEMNEHLFLLLNPLILPSSLLPRQPCMITRVENKKTKTTTTKLYFFKSAISFRRPICFGLKNENGSALPIISLSFLLTATRHMVHPCCGVRHWRASVLICNEKAQQKTFLLLQKVIYLGTSQRCHIYPAKRQRSKQVIWDMSKSWTGRERKRLLFHFKRNISNPATLSLWSQVKLKISPTHIFFLNDKGYFKAVFFFTPRRDSGRKMKKGNLPKTHCGPLWGFFTLFTTNTFFIQITSLHIFIFASY